MYSFTTGIFKGSAEIHNFTIDFFFKGSAEIHNFTTAISKTVKSHNFTTDVSRAVLKFFITKTRLFKYIEHFTTKKGKFSDKKNSDIFHISAQNIDFGYSLEPPRWGGSNEYPQSMFLSKNKKNYVYPCKHQFYYIKVGYKVVNII